jgi:hypothetical protein
MTSKARSTPTTTRADVQLRRCTAHQTVHRRRGRSAENQGLEQVRDYFDRNDIGLILIGRPGFERQLARYPQYLYSRIGFAHQYRPLDPDDVPPVLALYWTELGLTFNPEHPVDGEAALAITRITGGNFRLIERLLGQVAPAPEHQPARRHHRRSRRSRA